MGKGASKKSRKQSRYLAKCKRYFSESKRIKNKVSKLMRKWKNYKIQPPLALRCCKKNAQDLYLALKKAYEMN